MSIYIADMVFFECWVCGRVFGMTETFRRNVKARGLNFYCVGGCKLLFGESEVDRLQRELDEANNGRRAERDRRLAAEERAAQYQCPYCPARSYKTAGALQRHLANLHGTRKRLPQNAGPDAHNSDLWDN